MTKHRFWTTAELAIIRREYPAGGINACEVALKDRTRSSIYNVAGKLKLRSPNQKVAVRQSWPRDEHMDQQIRFAHQQTPTRGSVTKLAKRLGRPEWWVSKRARELGLTTPRFRELPWSDAELAIVAATSEITAEATQRALKRAGFVRSITACVVKRKRLGIGVPARVGEYLTGELAGLLGYERSSIARWINLGMLAAARDGDQHRITDAQLRTFLITQPLQVDLRKLPLGSRPWFYEMLTGSAGVCVQKATA